MGSAFIFLCKLAWTARYRIPIIIAVAFMALDIRMQVEVNVQMSNVRRQHRMHRIDHQREREFFAARPFEVYDDSDWVTTDDDDDDDDEDSEEIQEEEDEEVVERLAIELD